MPIFSDRHGYEQPEPPITVREGDPGALRQFVWSITLKAGANPAELAELVLDTVSYVHYDPERVLVAMAQDALLQCPWYQIYDVAERIYAYFELRKSAAEQVYGFMPALRETRADRFQRDLNAFMRRAGIGWQMIQGKVEVRGPEALEAAVHRAADTLQQSGRNTAENELREALRDMSRRPTPDLTGAVQHAGAALECVARDVTGDPKKTLGDILKARPGLFPRPLDEGAAKFWGFVSNYGRHVREGRVPTIEETLFVVGIAASLSGFIATRK
jgi:hypothetical protein